MSISISIIFSKILYLFISLSKRKRRLEFEIDSNRNRVKGLPLWFILLHNLSLGVVTNHPRIDKAAEVKSLGSELRHYGRFTRYAHIEDCPN